MEKAHYEAISAVVRNLAKKYSRQFNVDESDLFQEGWVHALLGYAKYWEKCKEHSLSGLRGWIYRWVYVRIAMYVRKNTCPVSFPKKAVPDAIKAGVVSVSWETLVTEEHGTRFVHDNLDEAYSRAQFHQKVDAAMGKIFASYPLAEIALTKFMPATKVAKILGKPKMHKEVRRQVVEAEKEIAKLIRQAVKERNL